MVRMAVPEVIALEWLTLAFVWVFCHVHWSVWVTPSRFEAWKAKLSVSLVS